MATDREGVLDSGTFDYRRAVGYKLSASGDLSAPGAGKVITLRPMPHGLAVNRSVYISGGGGSPEAAPITAVSGSGGGEFGTVTVTTGFSHTGEWTISSATAGIQEALETASGPCSIMVPAGQHTTYSSVIVERSGITISGTGGTSSRIAYTGTVSAFVFTSASVESGNRLSSLYLDGTSRTAQWAVTIENQNTFTMQEMFMVWFQNGIVVQGPQSFNIYLENVNVSYFAENTGIGVWLNGGAGHYLQNMEIASVIPGENGPYAGIHIQRSGGFYISQSDVLKTGQNALLISPGDGQEVTWGWVSDTSFDSCPGIGIHIEPTGTGRVRGVTVTSSWTASNQLYGVLITKGGPLAEVDTVQFIGHRSYNNGQHGYLILPGPTNLLFSDCQAIANSQTASGVSHGMAFGSGASKFQIVGGYYGQGIGFANSQGYGIVIAGGASDEYTIAYPVIGANVAGGLLDAGTGQNRVVKLGAGGIPIPTHASAATVDLGFGYEEFFALTGATTVTTITPGWKGRRIRFYKADAGSVTIGGGGNIPGAHTLNANQALDLVFNGLNWY